MLVPNLTNKQKINRQPEKKRKNSDYFDRCRKLLMISDQGSFTLQTNPAGATGILSRDGGHCYKMVTNAAEPETKMADKSAVARHKMTHIPAKCIYT